jgi:hypothetical protein
MQRSFFDWNERFGRHFSSFLLSGCLFGEQKRAYAAASVFSASGKERTPPHPSFRRAAKSVRRRNRLFGGRK